MVLSGLSKLLRNEGVAASQSRQTVSSSAGNAIQGNSTIVINKKEINVLEVWCRDSMASQDWQDFAAMLAFLTCHRHVCSTSDLQLYMHQAA